MDFATSPKFGAAWLGGRWIRFLGVGLLRKRVMARWMEWAWGGRSTCVVFSVCSRVLGAKCRDGFVTGLCHLFNGSPTLLKKRGGGDVEKDAGGLIFVCNGDDGRLGLAEEPLDGLTVRLVFELPVELEDADGTDDGDAEAAAMIIDLAVPVLEGALQHHLIFHHWLLSLRWKRRATGVAACFNCGLCGSALLVG
jgi:hypothetical protein